MDNIKLKTILNNIKDNKNKYIIKRYLSDKYKLNFLFSIFISDLIYDKKNNIKTNFYKNLNNENYLTGDKKHV